ncbi:MAG: hypothetical protein HZY75_02020 [Nocardioidaceae bacterium]|nr:MAG: hypothetical protein HZY75_02020 [Nocardioidaceae bacterium]
MVTAAGTEAAGPARVWVLTLAVCALLGSGLVACGRSQDDEAATRSLASSLRTGYAPIDAEQAACVAQSWVSEIGLETLSSSGALNHTTTNDLGKVILPRDDAIKAVDALNDCTDLAALTTQIVAGSLQATVSQTDCIQSVVDDRVATRWVEADLQGKATDDVFLLGAARCMSTPVADRRAISTLTRNLREVPGLSQSQADCVARGLVEQVGTHQLTAMGVLGKRQVLARALLRTRSPRGWRNWAPMCSPVVCRPRTCWQRRWRNRSRSRGIRDQTLPAQGLQRGQLPQLPRRPADESR